MSTSELADLERLLEGILANPRGFTDRVFQQLADRLGADHGGAPNNVVISYDSAVHEALVDQNVLLAAAVGACDCWGQDPACPVCAGTGSAGWTEPDRTLFEEYVAPAVTRMTAQTQEGEQP